MMEEFIDFISGLDWVQILVCTAVLALAFFLYLYHKRGGDLWRELCGKTHTYGRNGKCMICGKDGKDDPDWTGARK
jgi:hypothetical protein